MYKIANHLSIAVSLVFFALISAPANSGVQKDLPYPEGNLTAEELARQVYFVNHSYAVQNISYTSKDTENVPVLALREKDGAIKTNTFSRYLNNAYKPEKTEVKARDMVLFHSGNLRGTGILVTDYVDDAVHQSYSIWLPALKKIRLFIEPDHDTAWGGSDFTYGDMYLRKPFDETHEIVGTETFSDCLGAMSLTDDDKKRRYLNSLPEPQCEHKGKAVYKLKSTSVFDNWWYEYRISYIDSETFGDYRTDYYKNGEKIKRIDRDWTDMEDVEDPRGLYWRYWYGITYPKGHETAVSAREAQVTWNNDMKNEFWSEDMLKSLRK